MMLPAATVIIMILFYGHNGDVTIAWDIDSNSRELCAHGIGADT